MASLSWLTDHWFDLLQTVGIIGGLVFNGIVLRADVRAKRVQNLFTVTQHHRAIWEQLYTLPELSRVLEATPDIARKPITGDERLFVKFLFLHLYTVFRAIRYDLYVSSEELAADIHDFLALPIPRKIWEDLMPFQDRAFAEFVEKATIPSQK